MKASALLRATLAGGYLWDGYGPPTRSPFLCSAVRECADGHNTPEARATARWLIDRIEQDIWDTLPEGMNVYAMSGGDPCTLRVLFFATGLTESLDAHASEVQTLRRLWAQALLATLELEGD